MNPMPPSKFIRKNASLILTTVFGALSFWIIVLMAILLVTFDWFSSAAGDIVAQLAGHSILGKVLQLALFPVLLIVLWLCARRTTRQVVTHIREVEGPRKVRTLVLFLSLGYRTNDSDEQKALIDNLIRQGGRMEDSELRKQVKGSWRMPLEAIAYHQGIVKTVIVIPSKATEPQVETFRELVNALVTDDAKRPEVLALKDVQVDFPAHVDFESARDQDEALNQLLNYLSEQPDYRPEDIIIDITGGQKISSIAGAVVALGRERRIEYVSTGDYKVREYDITVEAEDVKC